MIKTKIHTQLVALVFAFTTIFSAFIVSSNAQQTGGQDSLQIINQSNIDLNYFLCDGNLFLPTENSLSSSEFIQNSYLLSQGHDTFVSYSEFNSDPSKTYTLKALEHNYYGQMPSTTVRTGGPHITFNPCADQTISYLLEKDFTIDTDDINRTTRIVLDGDLIGSGGVPYLRAPRILESYVLDSPSSAKFIIPGYEFDEICINQSLVSSIIVNLNNQDYSGFAVPDPIIADNNYSIRAPKYDNPVICGVIDQSVNSLKYLIYEGELADNTGYVLDSSGNSGDFYSRVDLVNTVLNSAIPTGQAYLNITNRSTNYPTTGVCIYNNHYNEIVSGSGIIPVPTGQAILTIPSESGCQSPHFYPKKAFQIEAGVQYNMDYFSFINIPTYSATSVDTYNTQTGLAYVGPLQTNLETCVDGNPVLRNNLDGGFINLTSGTYSISFSPILSDCSTASAFSTPQDITIGASSYSEYPFVDIVNPLYEGTGLTATVLHEVSGGDAFLVINNAQQNVVYYINTDGKCGDGRVGVTLSENVDFLNATVGDVPVADQQADLPGTSLKTCNLKTNVDTSVGQVETYISIAKTEVDKYDEVKAYIANSPWTEADSVTLESSEDGVNTYKITSQNYEQIALTGVDYDSAVTDLIRSGGQPLAITILLLPFAAVFALRHVSAKQKAQKA